MAAPDTNDPSAKRRAESDRQRLRRALTGLTAHRRRVTTALDGVRRAATRGEDNVVVVALGALAEQAAALEETLRLLVEHDGESELRLRAGARPPGRPPRRALADPAQVAAAPMPELLTEAAGPLRGLIRASDDPERLRAAHTFELEHDARASVLEELERRLRRLGAPVPRSAAPPARAKQPFPGYDELRATPAAREEVRRALSRRSVKTLNAALDYEQRTKGRATMVRAIEHALRGRT